MKNLFITAILMLVGLGATMAQKSKPDSPFYKITVQADKRVYSLGEPIEITVCHYNGSDSSWQFHRPDSTFYVSISYRHSMWRTQEMWRGHAFNTYEYHEVPNCPECGYGPPIVGTIMTIKPKDKYIFRTDIMEGYPPDEILPGQLEITVYDNMEALRSDTITVCIKFTPESVDYMLNRIIDEKHNRNIILWAINMLSDIYPDIKNYKFNWNYYDYIVFYSEQQRKDNEKLFSEFRTFWEQNRETDAVKACINKINTDLSKYYPLMDMRRTKLQKHSCIKY